MHSLSLAEYLSLWCVTPKEARQPLLPELFSMATHLGIDAKAMITLSDQIVREWQDWGPTLNVKTQDTEPFAEIANVGSDSAPRMATDSSAENIRSVMKLRILVVDDDRSTRI